MKPAAVGDVQPLPFGSQLVTAIQGRPMASTPPVPGQVIGWDANSKQWLSSYPPGYEIGYDQITTTVAVTGLTSASPTTVISAAAHTFDGAPVVCEFFCTFAQPPTLAAGNILVVGLFESATLLSQLATVQTPAASAMSVPVTASRRFTPTAGAHTYTISAWVTNTTGSPNIGAGVGTGGTIVPAYLRFTKV